MNNKNIILLIVCLLSFSIGARSQSKVEREQENMILTAVERLNDHDPKGAEKILSDVLAVNEDHDAAWYYMSEIAIRNYDAERAQQYLKKAIELDPGNFWYRNRLARLYSMTSQVELAVDMYEKLLDDFPEKSDLYYDMVELYVAQSEYDKALQTIEEIENVIGPSESLTMYGYRILYALGRDEEALEYLRKYNSRYSSPYVLSILADHEMTMYNDSTAIAYYNEALEMDSNFSPALLGKAEAYRVSLRYNEYFPALYRFLENTQTEVSEKTNYLSALMSKGDPKFLKVFRSQLDTAMLKMSMAHPKDSLIYETRGFYYMYTGRDAEAKKQFKECVDEYPESYSAAAAYVEYLMYKEHWEELSYEGRRAYERFPEETAFLEMASVGDYNLEEYEKVLDICYKVLEVAPNDSSKTLRSWSTIGDVYHVLGDSPKAYKAYDKALKINPDYIYVLNNYAYYLSVEGKNLKKAYEMSRKTIEAEPDNSTYLDTFGWILYLQGKPLEAKSFFKNAMLHGGKDSAVILDHYAEVLYALKEYDMAFIYWNMALQKDEGDVPGLKEKVLARKKEAGR